MAFANRKYKKSAFKPAAAKPAAKKAFGRAASPQQEAAAPERSERRQYGAYPGRGQRQQSGQQGDSNFIGITGMFPTKKGNSYQVFIKPEHLEILNSLQEGDSLGVTPSTTKEGRDIVRLWARKAE